MGNLGPGELLLIVGVALLLFGAGRIADIRKALGRGLHEADGDGVRIAAIGFFMALAIYWLTVSAAGHR